MNDRPLAFAELVNYTTSATGYRGSRKFGHWLFIYFGHWLLKMNGWLVFPLCFCRLCFAFLPASLVWLARLVDDCRLPEVLLRRAVLFRAFGP